MGVLPVSKKEGNLYWSQKTYSEWQHPFYKICLCCKAERFRSLFHFHPNTSKVDNITLSSFPLTTRQNWYHGMIHKWRDVLIYLNEFEFWYNKGEGSNYRMLLVFTELSLYVTVFPYATWNNFLMFPNLNTYYKLLAMINRR